MLNIVFVEFKGLFKLGKLSQTVSQFGQVHLTFTLFC